LNFYVLTVGSDRGKVKIIKTDVLLILSILNGPGEVVVYGRDSGGEGVTSNALEREGRPRISDHI